MSTIADRLATIQAEHATARREAGVTRTGRRTGLADQAATATRGDADRLAAQDEARNIARLTERARHDEARRLFDRAATIQRAIDASQDDTRTARLTVLRETVELRRTAYIDATYATPATEADWAPGGRYARYARRFDLGFIGYDADDIAQDAIEILLCRREAALAAGERVLMRGEPTATGSRTMGHTVGEGYRAIKTAYRRGLGFYGYQRRGVVVERDLSERGYHTDESETVAYIREAGERDAQVRADLYRGLESLDISPFAAWQEGYTTVTTEEGEPVEFDTLRTVERRRAALATLARRFPLTGDARMLALATLLAEGYTVGELTAHPDMPSDERTLTRWAHELSALVA